MTLRRLADELGLSPTTVSRALAGYDDVAAATRAKVVRAAKRLGYVPNAAAAGFRTGRSRAVGVVLPAQPGHFDDPFFLQVLTAIGRRLAEADFDLLVAAAQPGEAELKVYRRLVDARRVDGMIVARARLDDERIAFLQDRDFPFIVHGRTRTKRPYAWLDIDGHAAFRDATLRLAAMGHRRIALINAPDHYTFAHYREAGWRAAHAALAMPTGEFRAAEATEENGHRLAAELLALRVPPTALLCGTDRLAVGALRAIAQAGLGAGRDVSVIGYDDLPVASYTQPALTTVAQPWTQAGEKLVEMLLALFAGAKPEMLCELWQGKLVVRGSDGPVPGHDTEKDVKTTHVKKGEKPNAQTTHR